MRVVNNWVQACPLSMFVMRKLSAPFISFLWLEPSCERSSSWDSHWPTSSIGKKKQTVSCASECPQRRWTSLCLPLGEAMGLTARRQVSPPGEARPKSRRAAAHHARVDAWSWTQLPRCIAGFLAAKGGCGRFVFGMFNILPGLCWTESIGSCGVWCRICSQRALWVKRIHWNSSTVQYTGWNLRIVSPGWQHTCTGLRKKLVPLISFSFIILLLWLETNLLL